MDLAYPCLCPGLSRGVPETVLGQLEPIAALWCSIWKQGRIQPPSSPIQLYSVSQGRTSLAAKQGFQVSLQVTAGISALTI
uniref:Uncharacterized protein n=1 Tax=Timema poppense TaxID=170557 RepID=A0A7R9H9A0_TIMPO|nr:unnamed protein product [Timema poppensis]